MKGTVLYCITTRGAKACSSEAPESIARYANEKFPTTRQPWRVVPDAVVEPCWSDDECKHYVLEC